MYNGVIKYLPMLPSPTTNNCSWNNDNKKLPHSNVFHNFIHLKLPVIDMLDDLIELMGFVCYCNYLSDGGCYCGKKTYKTNVIKYE